MAIAFDNSSSTINQSGTPATQTTSHTTGSGSNRYMVVIVQGNNNSSSATSVTYNGTALIRLGEYDPWVHGEIFYMFAPPTGTADVVVTQGATKSEYLTTLIATYENCAQIQPFGAIGEHDTTTDTVSISITNNVLDGAWMFAAGYGGRAYSSSPDSTARESSGGAGNVYLDSNGTVAKGVTDTLTYVMASSNEGSIYAAYLIPDTYTKSEIEHCVDDDTVALWHMNGTAASAAKTDNAEGTAALDLTEVNTPTATTGFDGEANGAYQLTRANSEAFTVADNAALDFTGDLTFEMWLYPDSAPSGTKHQLLAKNSTASNESYQFNYRDSSGLILQFVSSDDGAGTGEEVWSVSADLGTGAWKHVAMAFDASASTAYFYVDGVLVGSDTNTNTSIYAGTSPLTIGGEGAAGTTNTWDGRMDEVVLSSRCKSAEEIAKYYSGTVSAKFRSAAGANSPVDGYIYHVNANWANAREDATGTTAYPTAASGVIGSNYYNGTPDYRNYRSFFLYNTSSLPDSGITLSLATLNLFNTADAKTDADSADIDIVSSNLASDANITTSDYQAIGTTVYGSLAIADWTSSTGYHNIIPITDTSCITQNGLTQLAAITSRDTDDSAPTGYNVVYYYLTDQANTNLDPYLWVEYTAGATAVDVLADTSVATFTVPDATITHLTELFPDVMSATFTLNDPIVTTDLTILPDVMVSTFTIPAVTVEIKETITPSVMSSTFTVPTPTISYGYTISPDVLTATFSIPQPTRIGPMWSIRTKPTTSWSERTKPTTSWSERTKPTTSWTKR